VEVKPVADDVPQTADGRQVARYWRHYGCVLVTNYRDFLLAVKEPGDKTPRVEARYSLAADEGTFWRSKPHTLAKQHGEGLLDFLAGAMTRTSRMTRPAGLAADLARHAREAKRRLAEHDMSAVEPLQNAMEQALGLHFQSNGGMARIRTEPRLVAKPLADASTPSEQGFWRRFPECRFPDRRCPDRRRQTGTASRGPPRPRFRSRERKK
jgi:hypothetical protein